MSRPPETPGIIAGGTSALIQLQPDTRTIAKIPWPDPHLYRHSIKDLAEEFKIYQILPRHPRLLSLQPTSSPERLVLPYLKNGCLKDYLRERNVTHESRLQFAADAAEGLEVLHSYGVVHGDISCWNFLVDDNLRLRIIDFAGSTTKDVTGSAFESVRYCLPRAWDDASTVKTDLFALGSLLSEIESGEEPYESCEDEEVECLFRRGRFPSTEHFTLGRVIQDCWRSKYESAGKVYQDIMEIIRA